MLEQLQPSAIPFYYDAEAQVKSFPTLSSPVLNQNPLLAVKIPDSIIGPDLQYLQPFSSPNIHPDPIDTVVEKSEAVIGSDAQHLAPPSFATKSSSKVRDRNPLCDISLPNAIVAPDFNDGSPTSTSPLVHSARNFSSLACPPQLLPHEWNSFITDLQQAAARSDLAPTSCSIAIGIATNDDEFNWGKWHYLAVQDGKTNVFAETKFEPEWRKESVGVVVERANENWAERGVRIALEVKK